MAEYIESVCRRCFHSYVCEQFNEHRDSNNEKCHFFHDHFATAADVQPVVHARWERKEIQIATFGVTQVLVCTNCGYDHEYDEWFGRCPNCGARMDGDSQ